MNLSKLFETQKELDERIVKEKGLQGQDLLDEKILALQVELGELANEWRGFKFWSENQRPNVERWVECKKCDGTGDLNYEIVQEDAEGTGGHEYIDCDECDSSGTSHMTNPMLEEYVDCLHFILSIGDELGCKGSTLADFLHRGDSITKQFKYVFYTISSIDELVVRKDMEDIPEVYGYLLGGFSVLGEMLGFTWEQVEQAYYEKNKINHERQVSGY